MSAVNSAVVLLGVAICLATYPACESAGSCSSPDADVVIVGAGMAGISAANTFHQQGMTSFLVLEARSEIGGRMRVADFAGVKVEVGANWIHEVDTSGAPRSSVNPIWTLKQRCDLQGFASDFTSSAVYDENAMNIRENSVPIAASLQSAYERIRQLRGSLLSDNQPDISVRVALSRNNWNPTTPIENLLDWQTFDFCFAEAPEVGSLYQTQSDAGEDFGNEDFFVTDQRGYVHLVNCLAQDFLNSSRLRLNTRITRMEYNDSCTCAVSDNSTRFCGRYGLVTFPIGVLKNGSSVTFDPPLPQAKLNAIDLFTSALYLKIFVEFNTSFWDNVQYVYRASQVRGDYSIFQPLSVLPSSPNALLVTVTGDTARRVAAQNVNTTKQEIMAAIRSIYPNAQAEIVNILVPDWQSNPLYYGAYSFPNVGSTPQSRDAIAAPVGRLYFSGEAVSRDYPASVHGAYFAGIDTANAIIRGSVVTTGCSVALLVSLALLSIVIHN